MNIIQIYKQFPNQDDCLAHIEKVRWKGTPTCPYCGSTRSTRVPKERRHHCNACKTSYSVTVGTIFHHTHLDIQKWLLAISLILNAKKGLSARQLARDIEVNRNTAWRMSMQIRKAMYESAQRELLQSVVEMDAGWLGGKLRKGNSGDGTHKRGRGTDKTPVLGMAQRGGNVSSRATTKVKLKAEGQSLLVRRNEDIKNTVL